MIKNMALISDSLSEQSAIVILPAGGSGTRFGGLLPKQYHLLGGTPLYIHALRVFDECPAITRIVMAINMEYGSMIREHIAMYNITCPVTLVEGGAERQFSIFNALQHDVLHPASHILVHDAVRPFITRPFIENLLHHTRTYPAVVPGLVPKETIKEVSDIMNVVRTPDRARLRSIQTPQAFHRDILLSSYQEAIAQNFIGTDDASIVEFAGCPVHVIHGLEYNIKITTPMDMAFAETLLHTRGRED
jgi:2-C-methyl-D-erythritol 4-phosphate cytidylyltransferase